MIQKLLHIFKSEPVRFILVAFMSGVFGAGLLQLGGGQTPVLIYVSGIMMWLYWLIFVCLHLLDPYSRALWRIAHTRSVVKKVDIFYERLLPLLQSQLPQSVYRYVALGGREGEDEKRFLSLERDAIWCSRADCFNDLFEGADLYYSNLHRFDEAFANVGELQDRQKRLEEYLTEARRDFLLCSFSKAPTIAPMWAHYAGNHRGFCIEYEVINPVALFEVEYNDPRPDIGPRMEALARELALGEIGRGKYEEVLKRQHKIWCVLKSGAWAYEQEVRAVFAKRIYPFVGENLPSAEAGLKIKGIYLGCFCAEKDRARLKCIADKLGIFCREVEPDYFGRFSAMKVKEDTQ